MVVSTLHVFGFVLSLVLLLVWCLIAECLLMPVWFIWFGVCSVGWLLLLFSSLKGW